MFLPIALYFALFSYYPFFKGIAMSFQANRLIGKKPFVGFSNYAEVLADPDFARAILNSLVIGLADMVLYFGVSLFLALCIWELGNKAKRATQTVSYLPYLFSWSVIAGIWILIFDQKGIVNALLGLFGAKSVFFLAESDLAKPLIIAMGVWRSAGYFALLFIVAITGIDPALYEAAQIDGASRLTQIRRITLPALRGAMKVVAVLLTMGVLTHFDEMFVMQNPVNKTRISTLLVYVFEMGIVKFKAGFATAGATLVMAGTLAIVAIVRKAVKYDES
ncbi:MAG: ABC transporter permease subunit [Spirochaetaceae bacterium]|nr:ABC transporter permease subunit [Spirochaetaceae bacterium]